MTPIRVVKSELLAVVLGAGLLFACDHRSGSSNATKTEVAAASRTPEAVAPGPPGQAGAPAPGQAPAASAPAKASVSALAKDRVPPPAKAARPPDPSAPVEVEMTGKIVLPENLDPKSKKVLLYVAHDNCLDPRAKVYAATPVSDSGNFFSEVFAPPGTDLSLCAAVDEGEGKPATIYGALERKLHAVGQGEVVFSRLVIKLKHQRPHRFQKK